MRTISRVAVLGAGTMGSRIAAHFANAGIPSLLLDLTVDAARKGIEAAVKQKPGGFFLDSEAARVTPGSFDTHLARIADCDWVIEAVTENLEIKRELWRRVEAQAGPDAILSTNTSGIPLRRIAEGFAPGFRRRFLGTHFFNPPRYLHLLEVIPGPETDPEIVEFVSAFGDRRLGKGVVPCKDTPNFIGNRIGFFLLGTIAKIAVEDGYTRRGSGCADRAADRAAEERDVPLAGYCRAGRGLARGRESVSRVSGRSLARALSAARIS